MKNNRWTTSKLKKKRKNQKQDEPNSSTNFDHLGAKNPVTNNSKQLQIRRKKSQPSEQQLAKLSFLKNRNTLSCKSWTEYYVFDIMYFLTEGI